MKYNTKQEAINGITSEIETYKATPVLAYVGKELGVAKLVRDDRTFRIFVKEVQKAKSGKAVLVEMKVYIQKGGEEFATVRGHTYLPNFVLENKDVYWILDNKIHNRATDDPEDGNISIDKSYIPKEFNTYGNFWSNANDRSPEDGANNFLTMLVHMKEGMVKDLRTEVNTIAFMEQI